MEGGTRGLVIILAAFMIQFFAFGTTATIGVYNIELLEYFPGSTIGVSLIASLNYGIFLGSGPIVSFLMTKFSYRNIAIFGSALVVLGLLGTPLLPYIPAMCFCFGVMTGFGSCCAYIPSHVLSGLYFDKNRSLATGIATSGSGLGGAIMPIVAGLLIEHYSWKGSLVIVAGLCLHMFIFSALLRMPQVKAAKEVEISLQTPTSTDEKKTETKLDSSSESASAMRSHLKNGTGHAELKPLFSESNKDVSHLNPKPLVSEVNGGELRENKRLTESVKKLEPRSARLKASSKAHGSGPEKSNSEKGEVTALLSGANTGVNDDKQPLSSPKEIFKKPIHKPFTLRNGKTETSSLEDISLRGRSRALFVSSETGRASRQTHAHVKHAHSAHQYHGWQLSRSLSSLHTLGTTRGSYYLVLDDYDDSSATVQKHASVVSADEKTEDQGKKDSTQIDIEKTSKKPKSARHVYIFTHYGFNVYFLSNILWNAGCSIVSSFAPEYLRSRGLTSMEAAFLLGVFGFGCFIGGILGGILGNISWIHRQTLYFFANLIMGIALIIFPFMGSRGMYLTCLLVSGLAFGIILGLLIVVLTDLIGVESLGNGLGYLMLSNGIGTFIGPPLAGILKEATGGFRDGIILSGVFCIFGGLVMLLMPCKDLVTKLCASCSFCPRKRQKQGGAGSVAMVTGVEENTSC